MQTLVVTGASDDLVHVSGIKGADEFNVNPHRNGYAASFLVGGRMRIHAIYDGCWSFAVGKVDEDLPLPDWPIRTLESDINGYTMQLEIDVPDDVRVFWERDKDDSW